MQCSPRVPTLAMRALQGDTVAMLKQELAELYVAFQSTKQGLEVVSDQVRACELEARGGARGRGKREEPGGAGGWEICTALMKAQRGG